MNNRYDEWASGIHTLNINDIETKIYADESDYAELLKKSIEFRKTNDIDFKWMIDYTYNLAVKAEAGIKEEKGFKRYLWSISLKLLPELMIAFRLIERDVLEEVESKVEEKKE
jgi:hypothetical protein